MSSDSTKLTFVRCPSCRSLVPAVSTRCRMCGAALEKGGEAEEVQHQPTISGRVRQRTMSQPDQDMTEAAQQLRRRHEEQADSHEEAEEMVDFVDHSEAAEGEYEDDPLADFIGEDKSEDLDQELIEPFERAVAEELGNVLEPDQSAPQEAIPEENVSPDRAAVAQRRSPRVIVETGARRTAGLSFGRSGEKGSKDESVVQESRRALHQKQRPVRAEAGRGRQEQPTHVEDQGGAVVRASSTTIASADAEQVVSREQVYEPKAAPRLKETLKVQSDDDTFGRLYGWLVSYADPAGTAIELREGKFFLTRTSLKSSDLVIADASISTPHAMFTVGVKSGLVVQDLMSDRGVFVRRADAETYKREDGAVVVGHGDWLRFGDVEFLITLVAHVGNE